MMKLIHGLVRKLVRELTTQKKVQNVKSDQSDQKELFESQEPIQLLDLPELVLCLVCEHLSYKELNALRSTCKDLKKFVDEKPFTKLNLFINIFPYHRKLFYTNQMIGHPHMLHTKGTTSIFCFIRFRGLFCSVQRMIICGLKQTGKRDWIEPKSIEVNLDHLDCFNRLNHLEINEVAKIEGKLSMKELQIVSFLPNRFTGSSVELDCPRLRALKVNWCTLSLTSETNELDHLYGRFDCYDEDQLTRLYPNLRKVSTICFLSRDDLMKFVSDLLMGELSLPSLVQIGLKECGDLAKWDKLASSLENLKRNPRTKHIEFTLNGRPIDSPKELRQMLSLVQAHDFGEEDVVEYFSELMDNSLQFLNANPMLDWLLPAVFSVELHKRTELSEELIRKLENIEQLEFRWKCQPTEYQFELFARHCISLRWLRVYHLTITERLLEMLSQHMVNLKSMKIFECKCKSVKPLGKFRNLNLVCLDFNPKRDELEFIFSNSRTPKKVRILSKKSVNLMMRIIETKRYTFGLGIRRHTKEFGIKIHFNKTIQLDSLDDMMDHLNANWKFKKFRDDDSDDSE